ncbi:RidA family protein [Paucibacter sediminis]|uniref:RidA family protein n=1 Tax=Paucibacter sediminis TaxID=3019553 RepID=A0AA95NFX6_9BURK|nr:RidA family protein [Paucibacter sp. S2-9]WIT14337.1 RidA family protein [Paucibacter sp. S2-9]
MTAQALAPLGAYPMLRRRGPWVFVSGMSARQADGSCAGVTRLPGGELQIDVAEQTRVVIAKIRAALQSQGGELGDCVSLSCYLTDMRDFAAYNRAYAEFFDAETGPARTTVAVHQLPHPQMRIEITATACLGEPR